MASTIKLKRGSGVPSGGSLAAGEPALDLTNNKLYSSTDGTDIVEISATTPFTVSLLMVLYHLLQSPLALILTQVSIE
jgi:hypothetical protein